MRSELASRADELIETVDSVVDGVRMKDLEIVIVGDGTLGGRRETEDVGVSDDDTDEGIDADTGLSSLMGVSRLIS